MTKIDIFSGFLGAGKTTLIKKLLKEAYAGEKVVLIENEFGEIGIDGAFLKDAGVEITEMNSGCICCSLVGDFSEALKKVLAQFSPARIVIEPSGVGKLSDVIGAVQNVNSPDMVLNSFTTVVDANKCKMYIKNFGEFFINQVEYANSIILSHTDKISEEKLEEVTSMLREHNADATIVTTPWDKLDGKKILSAMEKTNSIEKELEKLHDDEICPECGHHHEHDEHEHCHHDHDEHEHCHHDDDEHEHCHHDHDEHEHCHHDHDEHEHCHHDHDEHEHCHHGHDEHEHCHHGHDEHGHHHADDVFVSMGIETARKFDKDELTQMLSALENQEIYGIVLRAKGIVEATDGTWIYFDYVPGEPDVRAGSAEVTGRLCVIGSKLNQAEIKKLFRV